MGHRVTLEILVCPSDIRYAAKTIRHQLRVLGGQVQEVLFAVDVVPPTSGRYADGWGDALPALEALIDDVAATHPNVRVVYARGEPAQLERLSKRFFGGRRIPAKCHVGSAFEAYWLAFESPANDHILHVDCDMLFGGGSQTWVAEAVDLLAADERVISVKPLSGPPHPDGLLLGQPAYARYPHPTTAFRIPTWTTRLAFFDRRRLLDRLTPLPLLAPVRKRSSVKALVKGNPLVAQPEDILRARAIECEMYRVDLLGSDPGMWTLHPALKPPEFHDRLDELIGAVEAGDLPTEQLGHYDIVDAWIDQSAMRRNRALTRWR
jgi:hypothetical protein